MVGTNEKRTVEEEALAALATAIDDSGSHLAVADTAREAARRAVNAAVSPTRWWGQLLILQLAVIGGALAVFHGAPGGWQALVSGPWQIVLITSATMSLGFGAATLLYGRLASRDADQLEREYRSLASRADLLLKSTSSRREQQEAESLRAR